MKNFLRLLPVLALMTCSGFEGHAAPAVTTEVAVPEPLSPASAAALLTSEQHLTITSSGLQLFDTTSPQYALYQKQIQAINFVGQNQLASLIPQLLDYADYPANNEVSTPLVFNVGTDRSKLERLWPTYRAIMQIGDKGSPELLSIISNTQYPLRTRLTALQLLHDIDPNTSRLASQRLAGEAQANGQLGALPTIESIISGQLPFWGEIGFQPVTLTPQQVVDLLDSKRKISEIGTVLLLHGFPATMQSRFARGRDLNALYDLYLQQSEAIRTAGEMRQYSVIPNLVQFMEYTAKNAGIGTSSIDDNTEAGDRRRYIAIDAILKMGDAAKAPLEALVADNTQTVQTRVRALYVLYYLDATAAQTIAQGVITQFEKLGDSQSAIRVRAAVSGNQHQRPFAQIM